jgi:hypothetical protein
MKQPQLSKRPCLLNPKSGRVTSRLWLLFLCLGLAFGAFHEGLAQFDPLSNWHWRNPLPTGARLNAVAYGNGMFVAVGDAPILVSGDGIQWSVVGMSTNALTAVTYGNGIFVAVGWDRVTATSANGLYWQSGNRGIPVTLEAVAYGDGRFVAVGGSRADGRIIFTSSNGVDWAAGGTNAVSTLWGITYANGIFVAVGEYYDFGPDTNATRILTSEDGLHWTRQQVPVEPSPEQPALMSVIYGQGQFVAVGNIELDGPLGPLILTSPDGTNWSRQYYSEDIALRSVTYGAGRYIAGGWDLLTSLDGIAWNPVPTQFSVDALTWGGGLFVGVGGELVSSANGLDWSNHTQGFYGPDWDLNGVTSTSNLVVAVGGNRDAPLGLGGILVSTNALNWMLSTSGVFVTCQDVIHAAGKFVVVGTRDTSGAVLTSDDGLNWSQKGSDYPLRSIAYGNGLFVAAGGDCRYSENTYFLTSSDGELWIDHYLTNGRLQSIAFGNGLFVAVGGRDPEAGCDATAMTSVDGAHWTPLAYNPVTAPMVGSHTVVYGNGRFVAADLSGRISTSIEGRTWQFQTNLSNLGNTYIYAYPLPKLVYANHTFFFFSPLFTSEDGANWALHPEGSSWRFNSLTYANGTCISVGDGGTILQSDPVPPAETSFGLGLRFTSFPELILSSGLNRAFQIEYRNDLGPAGSWQTLRNLYPTTNPFYWTDTQTGPPRQGFYRALMLP